MKNTTTNKRVSTDELRKCFESIAIEHKRTVSIIIKKNTLLIRLVIIISFIYMTFLFPISPLIISFLFKSSINNPDNIFNILGISFDSYLFKYSWGIGFISSILLALLIVFKAKEEEEKVKNNKYFDYYFIYLTVEELKKYLISNRKEHISLASQYYKVYINDSTFINRIFWLYRNFDLDDDQESIFNWIKLDKKTNEVLKELLKLGSYTLKKIQTREDYNLVISILEKITEYEYHVLKVNFSSEFSIMSQLLEIADDLKNLKPSQRNNSPQQQQTLSISKKILSVTENLLTNKNIFISFSSWLIILQIVTLIIALAWTTIYKIDIDSKIIVGIFGTSILGAITFSTNKLKNK